MPFALILPRASLHQPISPPILPNQHRPRHRDKESIRQQIAQRKRMSQHIARPIITPIQLGADDGAQIANGDLHGVGGRALRLAGDVDGGPAQRQRDGRVDAAGGEEGAEVGDARVVGGMGLAEQDAVADGGEEGGAEDEGGARVEALRDDGEREGEDEGEGVGWYGEELRVGGGVAKGFDDGGLRRGLS